MAESEPGSSAAKGITPSGLVRIGVLEGVVVALGPQHEGNWYTGAVRIEPQLNIPGYPHALLVLENTGRPPSPVGYLPNKVAEKISPLLKPKGKLHIQGRVPKHAGRWANRTKRISIDCFTLPGDENEVCAQLWAGRRTGLDVERLLTTDKQLLPALERTPVDFGQPLPDDVQQPRAGRVQDHAAGSGVDVDAAPGGVLAWKLQPGDPEQDAADCKAAEEAEAKRAAQHRGTRASRQQGHAATSAAGGDAAAGEVAYTELKVALGYPSVLTQPSERWQATSSSEDESSSSEKSAAEPATPAHRPTPSAPASATTHPRRKRHKTRDS